MNVGCLWRDLNPQILLDGGFKDRCVYQFRHTGNKLNGHGETRTRNPEL
jgi:hypothetical protein